jgi:peroxisomal coenzyme A diphosphatase NUDT7
VYRLVLFAEFLIFAHLVTSMSLSVQLDRLRKVGMQAKDLSGHEDLPRASVLVPLFRQHETLCVLLTQRPLHLNSHPGEVCFPGGRQDPDDESNDVETALREAWEEVGLERASIQPICRLATVESKGGLCVTPIVGLLEPPEVVHQLKVSKDEVEAVFTVPIEFFLESSGNLADKFDVPWSGGMFTFRTYFYPDQHQKSFKIFGLTAHVIHQVACVAIDESVDKGLSNAMAPVIDKSVRMEGSLWLWEGKYWREQYCVLTGGMLHQYSSKEQADGKSATAVKKNRMPLVDVKVTKLPDDEESKFVLNVSVLDGRIIWKVAAASGDLCEQWIKALSS